jgi:D-tyrosyl-tRNA(Tyr) deacylase
VRAVVQRVSRAEVRVETDSLAAIGPGLLVLLAVGKDDSEADAEYLSRKIVQLRIFEDPAGKMNLSVRDVQGEILLVSQFTLYGDCRKGNRPSFIEAAPPARAQELIEKTTERIRKEGVRVACGRFQARMQVHLVNEGPVTLVLDSRKEA